MPLQTHAKETVRRARHDAYRSLILEAAERVFADLGYADAKVQEIALAAGVATGTVYGIFPGKKELYRAVHKRNLDELARAYAEIPSAGRSVREIILARSEAATRFLTAHPNYLRMYLREAGSWGLDASELPEGALEFMDLTLYQRGVASGELVDEDPELIQSLTFACNQVQFVHWLRGGMREDPEVLMARIQAHTVRAFFRDDASAAPS